MGEADNALREEIEKVRERARLQALAQGLGPDAAAVQGNAAVEEFCARWGIRPEMVAPGVLRGSRPGPTTGQPLREEPRRVDLGSSPMRTGTNPGTTQAIRIADLLKKAKESEAAPYTPSMNPTAAGTVMPPLTTTRGGSNLSSLLQRMRSPEPAAAAPPPPAPPPAPAPRPAFAPTPPRPAAPAPGAVQRANTMNETLGGGGGSLSANAERRRQVLEEFDRTYAEVQSMLEQRIGVVDIALNDASKGISGVMAKAAAGGLAPQEMNVLADDVDRLRNHLTVMMALCDEFLQHMNQINASRPGGG